MKKQRGEIVIGSIAFICALLFSGAAVVKTQSAKTADSGEIKTAQAK